MKRAPLLLLLPALLVSACATSGGVDRALVEAGRQRRREQPPPSAADLRLEVDSFLENELPLERKRVDRALERETKLWRATFVAGSALGVLAASSGTVSHSDGSTKATLTAAGAVAAVAGGVAYVLRTPRLRACAAFLDGAKRDVASFRRNGIPPGEGEVATAVWHAWVDRVAAIRGYPDCAAAR